MSEQPTTPILFYDGECGLCHSAVQFVLKWDKKRQFKFAPLQGQTAAKMLSNKQDLPDSIIIWENNAIVYKSEAVFSILKKLPFPWKLFLIFRPLPTRFSDWVYDYIARNRYSWFGRDTTCPMPKKMDRDLFLG